MPNENNAQKKVLRLVSFSGNLFPSREGGVGGDGQGPADNKQDQEQGLKEKKEKATSRPPQKQKNATSRPVFFEKTPSLVDGVAVKKKSAKREVPPDFAISERVRAWAVKKGFALTLEARFEDFVSRAKMHGYRYLDWDEAFMTACRSDWARLGGPSFKKQVAL